MSTTCIAPGSNNPFCMWTENGCGYTTCHEPGIEEIEDREDDTEDEDES
jgi:hypothetical protein